MSFMCQTESKQRHEGSFRVACFSFLRAKATWEACVSTTENRGGGEGASRGPIDQKPSLVHPSGVCEGEEAEAAPHAVVMERKVIGRCQMFAGSIVVTVWRTWSLCVNEWMSHTVTLSVSAVFLRLTLHFFSQSCCLSLVIWRRHLV